MPHTVVATCEVMGLLDWFLTAVLCVILQGGIPSRPGGKAIACRYPWEHWGDASRAPQREFPTRVIEIFELASHVDHNDDSRKHSLIYVDELDNHVQ